jgi:hypothetical protein
MVSGLNEIKGHTLVSTAEMTAHLVYGEKLYTSEVDLCCETVIEETEPGF